MKLRSLEAFCAAVEEQSISGAARRLYAAQPSVSERLAELEREVQLKLLERSRRGVSPTAEGSMFYEQARRVLDEVETLEGVVNGLREKQDRKLRFAASSTLGEHLLPEWLWDFRRQMYGAVPELFVGNTREVIALVKGGDMAFGIIEGEEYPKTLEGVPILDDELVVVVPPDHAWAGRRVSVHSLAEEAFISREAGSGTREVVEKVLAGKGVELDVQLELGSTSAIKEAISSGLGFSIISRVAVRHELEARTLAVAGGFSIRRRFTLVRNHYAILNSAEQAFYNYLMEVRRRHGLARLRPTNPAMSGSV